ncbi:glycosyltransferase family 4 protein [Gammaproteobacteria bacterium]|nr:glycosyltransferase family 4 protein [Gammaproteobacteria bacterium]
MKIVINSRFATQETTGVQRFAEECSLAVNSFEDYQITYLAPKGKIDLNLKEKLGIRQFGIFKGHLWEQIDLPLYCIFTNSVLISFCGAPSLIYKKIIYFVHDIAFLKYPEFYSLPYRYFYRVAFNLVSRRNMKIAAVSKFTKKEFEEKYNISDVMIVNNTVNHLFREREKPSLPKILSGKEYILVIGSNDPRKNLSQLIQTYIKENISENLVIVGNKYTNFNNKSSSMSYQSDKIIYTGHLKGGALSACYINAKCLIYPSFYEGFGIPPLEAFYFKTPVAASDIEVHREVCENYAHYFSPYEIRDINSLIKKAVEINDNVSNDIHPMVTKYSSYSQKNQLKKLLSKSFAK